MIFRQLMIWFNFIILPLIEWGLYCNHVVRPSVRPSVCPSVRSHFRNRYLSFYWKKWFYIWYMALAWWLVPYLPFPGLPHIYFLITLRLTNERVGVFLARRSVQHLVLLFVLNATFSNIAAISWRPVLVVEEAGENHRQWASNC